MNKAFSKEKYWILVPAAGLGKRMDSETPKQYMSIAGRSILSWTLDRLQQLDNIEQIVLMLHPGETLRESDTWDETPTNRSRLISVTGGDERINSVMNGLNAIRERAADDDWILVHDAVRPCITVADIKKLVSAISGDPVGGLLATPVNDTIKIAGKEHEKNTYVDKTVDREKYWLASTPQMFRFKLLVEALESALEKQLKATDEAAAMEAMGHKVRLVEGRTDNIKVTRPADLPLVEFLLQQQVQA